MPGAPFRLRCEFASNPLGVTRRHPRLSWWVNDTRPAELQTAYEIMAATTEDKLAADEADIWHSGRVESDQSNHVGLAGTGVMPGERVWWKVRTFDSDGLASSWSEPATFHAGLRNADEWQAKWITSPLRGSRSRGVQAVALRREFVLREDVAAATLSVCALGDYRVQINGRQVPGADCNASWSDFSGQAYYQVFDVAHLLKTEPNCIGLLLADGYYAGALPGVGRANYGDRPQLLAQLDVSLKSGQRETVVTDESWLWRPSWVLAADISHGEHLDARQFVDGWSDAGIETDGWAPVAVLAGQALDLLAQPHSGFTARRLLQPVDHPRTWRDGYRHTRIYDFGEAMVGRVQLHLKCSEPDDIRLSYALQPDFGETTEDTYTSAGANPGEMFAGHFALHSFRYLRVEYTANVTEPGEVNALRVTQAETPSLQFSSDHDRLNKLFHAIQGSLDNVALSVPMQGLAAAQRLPQAASAATWVPMYGRELRNRGLVGKWVADLRHAFNHSMATRLGGSGAPNAARSLTIPALPRLVGEADEYASFETLVRTLWTLYRYHNDIELLRDSYGELRVAALSYKHANPDYLRSGTVAEVYGDSPWRELVATASMHDALRTTARIAGVLGHLGDYELLENLTDQVRKAFRQRYLSRDGHLLGDCQSVYVAALYHHLLEDDERHHAQHRLVELLQQGHYHPDVAPILVHALLPVLTKAGRLDIAYMVLLQTSAPSWLAAIEHQPGTIGREPGVFDIACVGVWEWLLESLVGLRLHEDYSVNMNGYRHVRIQPMPPFGAQFLAGSPVRFVEAGVQSPYGQ
jgi:alpha-L-rhamnosidase